MIAMLLVAAMLPAHAQNENKENKVTTVLNSLSKRFYCSGFALGGWEYRDTSSPNNQFYINKVTLVAGVNFTDRLKLHTVFSLSSVTLLEAWANYSFMPELNVKLGQFKTPFTVENPMSPVVLEQIYEDALATQYMVMGSNPLMMPKSGGRDLGISVYGSLFNKLVDYDLAIMQGNGRGKADNNSAKDFVARIMFNPVKQLRVGGSLILGTGHTDPVALGNGDYTDANGLITGVKPSGNFTRNRYAASMVATVDPVALRAEYMWGRDGKTNSDGGYITGRARVVKNLDVVASYDHLNAIDAITNRVTAGVNYWFYPKCRIMAAYTYTHTHGISGGENAILTELQLAF